MTGPLVIGLLLQCDTLKFPARFGRRNSICAIHLLWFLSRRNKTVKKSQFRSESAFISVGLRRTFCGSARKGRFGNSSDALVMSNPNSDRVRFLREGSRERFEPSVRRLAYLAGQFFLLRASSAAFASFARFPEQL